MQRISGVVLLAASIAITSAGLVIPPGSMASPTAPPKPSPTVPSSGVAYTIIAPRDVSPSGLVTRIILPADAECPTLVTESAAGGQVETAMAVRPAPRNTRSAFTGAVLCQALVPEGAVGQGTIVPKGQAAAKVPAAYPENIDKIAIFGDSGCGKSGRQNCFKARTWPLSNFATWAAENEADVLLHVGDYYYLDQACPKKFLKNCKGAPAPVKGAPFYDSIAGWMFQFFSMAKPLMSSVPIVAARGNMELCNLAGNGYFWLLDPGVDSANTCSPKGWGASGRVPLHVDDPYAVGFTLANGETLNVVVVDSSYVSLRAVTALTTRYRAVFEDAAALAGSGASQNWMVTQQPIFGFEKAESAAKKDQAKTNWVETFYTVASYGKLANFDAILDGHIHTAQVVQIPGAPATLTVGSTGHTGARRGWTVPEVGPLMLPGSNKPQFPTIGGYPKASFMWNEVVHAYAFATLQGSKTWKVDYFGGNKRVLNTCTLAESVVSCSKKSN